MWWERKKGAVRKTQRSHVIIIGTGRAGTTFLVQLLTRLGLDTGFAPDHMPLFENARAGLEHDLRKPGAPYIVKDPWFCDYAGEVLEQGKIHIDRAFIPMRDLHAAAESRALSWPARRLIPYFGINSR